MKTILLLDDFFNSVNLIPTGSIDIILTDPPYGITKNHWDTKINLDEYWKNIWRIAKPTAPVIMFSQGVFAAELLLSQRQYFKEDIIWVKANRVTGHLNAKTKVMRNHEQILVFYKNQCTFNPQFTIGEPLHGRGTKYLDQENINNCYGHFEQTEDIRKGTTQKYPKSVLWYDKPHPAIYPTEKPIDLLSNLILTYSNENDIVLDCFMGSGSTIAAAYKTKRCSIGIEKYDVGYNIAVERLVAINGKVIIETNLNNFL